MKPVFWLVLIAFPAFGQAPVTPAQPNAVYYPISDLDLFPTYTRASYFAATGVQAPACNPSLPLKAWFDSTANTSSPSNVAVYNVFSPPAATAATVAESQLVIPASQAATVNLPGVNTYPAYAIAPTDATVGEVSASGSTQTGINPLYLSTLAQAQQLAVQLGATGAPFQESIAPPMTYTFPADEPRRLWDITVNGTNYNVGTLLNTENQDGVGAPGTLSVGADGAVWTPAAQPDCSDVTTSAPVPIRPLLSNEQFVEDLLPGAWEVERTDLLAQQNAAGNVFTTADRATLQQILSLLQQLVSKQ